jgi:hypothetical protein
MRAQEGTKLPEPEKWLADQDTQHPPETEVDVPVELLPAVGAALVLWSVRGLR